MRIDRFLDVVADGNEQVIRARFADADFFIEGLSVSSNGSGGVKHLVGLDELPR